jgi:multicomponent Na+:H+ antiporter subunit D
MALRQTDLKRLIAFAAVAEIGYMFLGVGTWMAAKTVHVDPTGTATAISVLPYGELALQGGIFHLFNDAFDIGLLFLIAGAIYYVTKERSLDNISGLARNMKFTTIFFIIGLFAVAGLPPLNGFASKLLLYESTFQLNPILGIVAIVGSILLLAVFIKVFFAAFMGPNLMTGTVKKEPRSMIIAMAILAAVIILVGVLPDIFFTSFVEPATDALLNFSSYSNAVLLGGV